MDRPCTCDRDDCRPCWLYHNDLRYHRLWGGTEPTLLQKAGTFFKAAVRHVADGLKNVSEEQYQQRLAICTDCPEYEPSNTHCRKCGCVIAGNVLAKARWKSEDCPIGRWPNV